VKVLFTPLAQNDLANIYDYTLEKWGENQLRTYQKTIQNSIDKIKDNPKTYASKARNELVKFCRSIRAGKHLLFYVTNEECITILRILHESMDFKRHL